MLASCQFLAEALLFSGRCHGRAVEMSEWVVVIVDEHCFCFSVGQQCSIIICALFYSDCEDYLFYEM